MRGRRSPRGSACGDNRSPSDERRDSDIGPFYRVRSFSTCGKTVINQGDMFKFWDLSRATSFADSTSPPESSVFSNSASHSSSMQSLSDSEYQPPAYR